MNLYSALALTALLSSTAAFAQTTATAPTNAAPTNSSPTTSVNPATGNPTAAACRQQATDKNLTGADRKQFMKDCKAGKATS
jgi:hypothetical protein